MKGKEKIEKYKVEEWTVPNGEKKHFYAILGQNKSKKNETKNSNYVDCIFHFVLISWVFRMYTFFLSSPPCADPMHRLKLRVARRIENSSWNSKQKKGKKEYQKSTNDDRNGKCMVQSMSSETQVRKGHTEWDSGDWLSHRARSCRRRRGCVFRLSFKQRFILSFLMRLLFCILYFHRIRYCAGMSESMSATAAAASDQAKKRTRKSAEHKMMKPKDFCLMI